MRKLLLSVTVVTSMVLGFVGCGESNQAKTIIEEGPSFKEAKKQANPVYKLKTSDGEDLTINLEGDQLTSAKLNGKFVLLNFWATWCTTCKAEMPVVNQLHKEYGDKITIIGVLYEKPLDNEVLKKFMDQYNMRFVVVNSEDNMRLSKNIGLTGVPEFYLYSKEGKLLEKSIASVDIPAVMKHVDPK